MGLAARSSPPQGGSYRSTLTIFLTVAVVSAAALAVLTWQLVEQDRNLEGQRRTVRLEQMADALVATMQRGLTDLESRLGATSSSVRLPDDVIAISIVGDDLSTSPGARLLYHPARDATPQPPAKSSIFVDGERLEFAKADTDAALIAYARLAETTDAVVRAGASMRLGRVHRKRREWEPALRAYASLDDLDRVSVEQFPASLAARLGRLSVFEEAGRQQELKEEASLLASDLASGRWRITKTQFEAFGAEARRHAPDAPRANPAQLIHSEAVAWLWDQRGAETPVKRLAPTLASGSALVVWRSSAGQLDAVIAGLSHISSWAAGVIDRPGDWALTDLEGRPLVGNAHGAGQGATRMSRTSGLPWAVHVFPREGEPPPGSPRQVPLLLVLALVAVALVGGWTAIFRSLSREQRVAALQSDFIAAVSHEFRSPLTALSHASELLLHDRLSSDTSRREIHEVLARDSQRLRTLVEDLLEFGRLENGATPFSCEDTDLGGLVRSTIDACQQQVAPRGYVITTSGDLDDVHASVDREALSRALRNLLDNAVKYSPDCREIHVTLSRDEHSVRIAVSDRGLGIPLSEQATVFDRFVRGAESKRRRIPGTGIGLVMVRQIVRAHGGDVHLTSEPGRGSTFTVVLRGVRGVRLQPDLEAPGNPAKAGSHRTA